MAELILTREDIQADIDQYQARIQSARDSLASLPAKSTDWKQRKKLKARRRVLQEEVDHVNRLIGYANKALSEMTRPMGRQEGHPLMKKVIQNNALSTNTKHDHPKHSMVTQSTTRQFQSTA